MARPILTAEGLSKTVADRTLFENASFTVEPGDRVALVGPNGCGKSTLLEALTGARPADTGQVRFLPHVTVTYFNQHPVVKKGATVRDALTDVGGVPPDIAQELAQLEARMADPALYESGEADGVVARYGDLQREAARAKANAAGDPLDNPLFEQTGFTEEDLDKRVESLSGGERTRLFLCRTLTQARPDGLLILDEPTNHLDVETIEWLEEWLLAYAGALIVVAHDRAFLDNVATRVLSIERDTLVAYAGNYSEFERVRDEDNARLLMLREREQKELDRQKAVIEQFRHQKRFNGQMASRLTQLAKYRSAIDKTPDPLLQKVQFHVRFPETFKSSNEVIRVRGLGKKYGERILFYDLSLDVNKGDRVGLVGANGSGKTTLLRILTGRETKDVGTIEVSPGVKGQYYAQGSENLTPENTLRQEILLARRGIEDEDVRGLLGRFGFRNPQDLERTVGTLSGGERARLQLLKCIIAPSNLLILDEPTNHLDIESRAALVRALNAYEGTLLVVSHDRYFMDGVVNKVAVLARRTVRVFPGDFTEARTAAAMESFSVEKPTVYVVRKAFKDFDAGVKHTVGSSLALTPEEFNAKRLYKTALDMGWMAPQE